MKLLYELPDADKKAYIAAADDSERMMYCLPFNILGDKFVNGYMAFTNKRIYKLEGGRLLAVYELEGAAEFRTEVMYGICGFYARLNGATTLLCNFISGRNLPRYAVIVKALEILTEKHIETPVTNDTPERFCPKCGRPYVHSTTICPYCMDKFEVYKSSGR